jgi:hypothetical protein
MVLLYMNEWVSVVVSHVLVTENELTNKVVSPFPPGLRIGARRHQGYEDGVLYISSGFVGKQINIRLSFYNKAAKKK